MVLKLFLKWPAKATLRQWACKDASTTHQVGENYGIPRDLYKKNFSRP